MIKEDKVLVPINIRNISHFTNLGYDINDKSILVDVSHLNIGSKVKITAICEICKSENFLQYSKYMCNINRNNKGFYSCFNCKNIQKEKTCIEKYGFKSYSMTNYFKETESEKWKGKRKGNDKYISTMIERYGVDCYFKRDEIKELNRKWMSSDDFRMKSSETIMKKYGVEHYSKTDEFKNKIEKNKDEIVRKIKLKIFEIYGVDWISKSEHFKKLYRLNKENIIDKIKKTCLEKYGFDNVSKVENFKLLIKITKNERGLRIPDELLQSWDLYKRTVRKLTKSNKKILYENWNGYDYYDGEFIKGYQSLSHKHRFYPTIDHKISTCYGFYNGISPEEISDLSNLCITKRYINSKKSEMIEEQFKENLS